MHPRGPAATRRGRTEVARRSPPPSSWPPTLPPPCGESRSASSPHPPPRPTRGTAASVPPPGPWRRLGAHRRHCRVICRVVTTTIEHPPGGL